MNKNLLARVIMLPDGSAHIAMNNRHTIDATPTSLSEFLSDPLSFLNKGQFKYMETTHIANRPMVILEDIKGLTLLSVYGDLKIECIFPKLFQALFKTISSRPDEPINLKDIVFELDISDERHFLMRFFYEFTNTPYDRLNFENMLSMEESEKSSIMKETYDTFFDTLALTSEKHAIAERKADANAPEDDTAEQTKGKRKLKPDEIKALEELDEDMIIDLEYANLIGVALSTLKGYIREEKIRNYVKIGTHYYIHKDTPRPPSKVPGRKMGSRKNQGLNAFLNEADPNESIYSVLQKYLSEREGISREVGKFIRTKKEMNYYRDNGYKEVEWDGMHALIIDINPNYYCDKLGKYNRELIQGENSPVVPNGGEVIYFDLHHIGQKADSPFAIIPSHIHTKEKNNVFHARNEQLEDVHGQNYKIQKVIFWNKYLEMYDKYGKFRNIPGVVLRTAYDQLREEERERNKENLPRYRKGPKAE